MSRLWHAVEVFGIPVSAGTSDIIIYIFRGFPLLFQVNAGIVTGLGHYRSLLNPFQFCIYVYLIFFFSSSSNGLPFEHLTHEEFSWPQNVDHFA
jgi:ABC-type amino acid transport system permease subunit